MSSHDERPVYRQLFRFEAGPQRQMFEVCEECAKKHPNWMPRCFLPLEGQRWQYQGDDTFVCEICEQREP